MTAPFPDRRVKMKMRRIEKQWRPPGTRRIVPFLLVQAVAIPMQSRHQSALKRGDEYRSCGFRSWVTFPVRRTVKYVGVYDSPCVSAVCGFKLHGLIVPHSLWLCLYSVAIIRCIGFFRPASFMNYYSMPWGIFPAFYQSRCILLAIFMFLLFISADVLCRPCILWPLWSSPFHAVTSFLSLIGHLCNHRKSIGIGNSISNSKSILHIYR